MSATGLRAIWAIGVILPSGSQWGMPALTLAQVWLIPSTSPRSMAIRTMGADL